MSPLVRVLLLLGAGLALRNLAIADSLVVVGPGTLGPFQTTISFANPTAAPLECAISTLPVGPTTCFPVCPVQTINLPPHGTFQILVDFSPFTAFPLNTVFVTPAPGNALPTVKLHVANTNVPTQGVDLPVIRLSTLTVQNPTVLVFPDISRTATAHSNLVLGAIDQDGISQNVTVKLELYSAAGDLLGQGIFSNNLQNENLSPSVADLFIVDVARQLGVASLEGGQLRVTKISAVGSLWGEVATLSSDGAATLSVGLNP
jgi:hypothetical protein